MIMITRDSLNKSAVSYEEDFCPFCGKRREKLAAIAGRTSYRQCDCEENQAAVEEWSELLHREQECKDALEAIESQIVRIERKGKELLEKSNLGRRFRDRTFETFQRREDLETAYRSAKEYAEGFEENKGESLLFMGTPGTGKTHLAAAITNYVITQYGIPVKFGSFIDILESIKKTFGGGASDPDQGIIRQLIEVPLLVIDDLGKERQTDWSNSVLYQVINGRYENYLPVIITTNETIGTMEKNVGKATVSRLIEMCSGIKMTGPDYRKQKMETRKEIQNA